MKKFAYSLIAAVGLFQADANAQCAVSADFPIIQDAFGAEVALDGMTPAAASLLTQAANAAVLPNTEYMVIHGGQLAMGGNGQPDTTGGGGLVVLGADDDGAFSPEDMTRYGYTLVAGDTFLIVPVGYNLTQVKNLADALLNNEVTPGTPCCSLFGPPLIPEAAGFCDSVNNAGIMGAADINNLNDVLVIFDAMTDNELSMNALDYYMAQVNSFSFAIPVSCGKNELPLCYGWGSNAYRYPVGPAVSVNAVSSNTNFALFPNPTAEGYVNVLVQTQAQMDLTMSVYNMLGERVQQQNFQVNGQFNATISTASLSAGMYVVEINDGANKVSQKLVVR